MFEYIKGILTQASPIKATVETHGIGYLLFIPLNNYSKLPQIGSPITFYIASVIREDSHKNYGFLTSAERDLFLNLIETSGVGPKMAISLLGHMEIHDLQFAIAQANIAVICKIPGIGKKTAERLIIELKDKLSLSGKKSQVEHPLSSNEEPTLIGDAISALINLGYHPLEAQKAIRTSLKDAATPTDLAKLITSALRCIK
ncbi:MAG: Holliday junction branch migration protein RuvA [Chlamydiales bacterium]|nr:Holliday junction branch migration protein RuvA [Chlamydiales bacterium]